MMQLSLILGLILLLLWIIWKIVVSIVLTVSADSSEYARDDVVGISGTLQNSLGSPISGETVNLIISPPSGDDYVLPSVTTQADGSYSTTWTVPITAVDGTHTISANALSTTATATFTHNPEGLWYKSQLKLIHDLERKS